MYEFVYIVNWYHISDVYETSSLSLRNAYSSDQPQLRTNNLFLPHYTYTTPASNHLSTWHSSYSKNILHSHTLLLRSQPQNVDNDSALNPSYPNHNPHKPSNDTTPQHTSLTLMSRPLNISTRRHECISIYIKSPCIECYQYTATRKGRLGTITKEKWRAGCRVSI